MSEFVACPYVSTITFTHLLNISLAGTVKESHNVGQQENQRTVFRAEEQ